MVRLRQLARETWDGPGGGREVLRIGFPLILSQLSYTLQSFVDRLFLTWYSPEAVAGAVTGLFTVWALVGLFIGTGEYLTAFIGQYYGARRHERIGVALWQGIWFALAAGAVCVALVPLLPPVFALAGHAPLLQEYEVSYAGIFLGGSGAAVLMATLSTFFAGRGQTRVILIVNVLVTLVNVGLDWWWIFDQGPRAGYGVAGAAWATVVSQAVGALAYLALILRPAWRAQYGTLRGWRLEPELFRRLLRFGLPTGLQYSMEIAAFSIFLLIVGRLGTAPLAATSLSFNLNGLVFMPMLGLGVGVSSLVARYLGAEQPEVAERVTWSAFKVSLVYMGMCGLLYLLLPRVLLAPFASGSVDPAAFAPIEDTAVVLLRFVAFYSVFDMANVIFAAGLKGAGDTSYPLKLTVVLAWSVLLPPTWIGCVLLPGGLYVAWCAATVYVFLLGVLMHGRFRAGGWKGLRIVEPQVLEET